MSDDLKLFKNFLENYRILYGNQLFVDKEKIENIAADLPDFVYAQQAQQDEAKPAAADKVNREKSGSPLWKFKSQIKDCTKCALGHTRTKFVFGDGNENADIMFVGEAPGADEDRTGIPFVGRAGKLLEKLLAEVNIKREDVFIANILKCRPPNNRDPLPEETEKCFPYLYKQIELIKPQLIVALGRIAAQKLLETNSSLKQLRERLWQYRGVDMIVTYHPAAILRNAGFLSTAQSDFKYILETYQEKLRYKNK